MTTARRIALVTGGNKGIGLEISRNLGLLLQNPFQEPITARYGDNG